MNIIEYIKNTPLEKDIIFLGLILILFCLCPIFLLIKDWWKKKK